MTVRLISWVACTNGTYRVACRTQQGQTVYLWCDDEELVARLAQHNEEWASVRTLAINGRQWLVEVN